MRTLRASRACIAFGSVGVAAAVGLMVSSARGPAPGRLMSQNDFLTWYTPDPRSDLTVHDEQALFHVVNRGGAPVTVLSCRISCGCVQPEVYPRVIEPGGIGIVVVQPAYVDVGEKLANVVLLTDSPATPKVVLHLNIIGYAKTPYLSYAEGDLFYTGAWSPQAVRTLTAVTVQSSDENAVPKVTSDLPFLGFEADAEATWDETFESTALIARHYVYRVTFLKPPQGFFHGEVTVQDPWNRSRYRKTIIFGEPPRTLKVMPKRLVLDVEGKDGPLSAVFHVWTTDLATTPSAVVADEASAPLSVRSEGSDQGVASFRVALERPEAVSDQGVYKVLVRAGPSSSTVVEVPVMVRRGGGP